MSGKKRAKREEKFDQLAIEELMLVKVRIDSSFEYEPLCESGSYALNGVERIIDNRIEEIRKGKR